MDLLMSTIGFIIAVIGGLALNILASDLYDRCPRLARWLMERAVARLPADMRDRYREEWEAHLLDCPTKLDQVRHALGVWWGAGRITQMRPREKMRVRISYLIAGSTLTLVGQTGEVVSYILAGAPWWIVVGYIIPISSAVFVVVLGLRIKKRRGDIIEL